MVLVIATAGLVYELAIAAVASYLLGDSIRQFSLVIGGYLSALGLGAYLSRYVDDRLAVAFVDVELAAAVVGGLSVPALSLAFAYTHAFQAALFAVVAAVGILVGLELPLLFRLLEKRATFKELVSRALTFDYAGALVGSVAFSLVLVPQLGLSRSSIACGLLNAAVGLAGTWLLPPADEGEARALRHARVRAGLVTAALAAAFAGSGTLTELADAALYPGPVVLSRQTPYQRIVFARHDGALELFLNGNLQFSSRDEYRYHEALVHPAMAAAASRRHVVVGGGGDGLAVREILKWPDVERVTLVDLDGAVTELAATYPPLVSLNRSALFDRRVSVVTSDAMQWFDLPLVQGGEQGDTRADVVVLDFPDPGTYSVGKLYTTAFYARVRRHLRPGAAVVVQSSSPELSPETFWCIVRTLEAAGFYARPYHAFVPSFGTWGFVLALEQPFPVPSALPDAPLSFLGQGTMSDLFVLPERFARRDGKINRLETQALVSYYGDEWRRWDVR
jgi:spermidine synthase